MPAIAMPRNTRVKLSRCSQLVTLSRHPWKLFIFVHGVHIHVQNSSLQGKSTSLCRYPSWPASSSTWQAVVSFGFGFSHGFSVLSKRWTFYRMNNNFIRKCKRHLHHLHLCEILLTQRSLDFLYFLPVTWQTE